MAVVLARPAGAPDGSRGLACFIAPRYGGDTRETADGVRIHRLKDKFGRLSS